MSEFIRITAADGHELDAYVAEPAGTPIAGLVVVQEIFGVNDHIRRVADGYAADGFYVVAPSIFDRIEPNVELGYEGEDRNKAIQLMQKLDREKIQLDVAAAVEQAKSVAGNVGVIGYCLGGTQAWLSASRLPIQAAVGYYGGGIGQVAAIPIHAPVILHFGLKDAHIGADQRDAVHAAHPAVPIYTYDADHGFNCDARASYDAPSAALARERSLAFLKEKLA